MSTPMVITHTQERMRLPTLRRVMIASLVGTVLVYIVLQALIIQELVPPLAIITALPIMVVIGPLRVLLLVSRWKTLR